MKKILAILFVVTVFVTACKKDKASPTTPTLTTAALTNITTSGATAGGTITNNGGADITASGIVLSKKNSTPTLLDTVLSGTTSSGSFTTPITGLDFNTVYYIRAYATNSIGTGYGQAVTLNTTNDTTKVRFTYNGQQVVYGVITSPTTGKKWMDRNLGASAVATSSTDTAGYGHLFQWGRLADGHQFRSSTTTITLSALDVPGNNQFIITDGSPNNDWRNPQNAGLWQGSGGTNNPCPNGWHIPTIAELSAESGITNSSTAFSVLKMTVTRYRWLDGDFYGTTAGRYWSSTAEPSNGTLSYVLSFNASSASTTGVTDRGHGFAIRCIKD